MPQTPPQRASVGIVNNIQQTYHGTVVKRLLARFVVNQVALFIHMHFLGFQQFGAEHRRQRDSHDGGCTANDRNNPTEFVEHDSRHTVEHRQRHKYSYKHESGGNNRYPHLICSIDCRLMRVFATFHMPRYVLKHNDGIVHHHTDSDGQRTQ